MQVSNFDYSTNMETKNSKLLTSLEGLRKKGLYIYSRLFEV